MAPYVRVGNYLLKKKIGEGAFAEVRHAVHEETGEEFAVKVFDRSIMSRNHFESDVKKEIRIMQHLRHPNIVSIHAVLVTTKKMYLVMELVRGGELYDEIVSQRRIDEDTSRKYFQQLVDAMVYCHRRGVVHRDLKPENLLLDGNGNLKVTDFGMSWMKSISQNPNKTLLRTQCGTPKYMAPEVIVRPPGGYDGEKLDAWECGMVLFALLAGYLPFAGDNDNAVFHSILNGSIQFPDFFSTGAKDVLLALLQKDPNRRTGLEQIRNHPWFCINYTGDVALDNTTVPISVSRLSHMKSVAKSADVNTTQRSSRMHREIISSPEKTATLKLQNVTTKKPPSSSTSPHSEQPSNEQADTPEMRKLANVKIQSSTKETSPTRQAKPLKPRKSLTGQDPPRSDIMPPELLHSPLPAAKLNMGSNYSKTSNATAMQTQSPEKNSTILLPDKDSASKDVTIGPLNSSLSSPSTLHQVPNCLPKQPQITSLKSEKPILEKPKNVLSESPSSGPSSSARHACTKTADVPQAPPMHSSFYEMLHSPTSLSPSPRHKKPHKVSRRRLQNLKPDADDFQLNEVQPYSPVTPPSGMLNLSPKSSLDCVRGSQRWGVEEDNQPASVSRSSYIPQSLNFASVLRLPNLSPLRFYRKENVDIEFESPASINDSTFKSMLRQRRSPRNDRSEQMGNILDSSWFSPATSGPSTSPHSMQRKDRSPRLFSKFSKGASMGSSMRTMREEFGPDDEDLEEEQRHPEPVSSPWRFFYRGSHSKAK